MPLVHDCLSKAVMNGIARRSKNRVTSLEASPKLTSLEASPNVTSLEASPNVTSLEASPKLTSLEASPIMPLAQGYFARVNLLIGKFTLEILKVKNYFTKTFSGNFTQLDFASKQLTSHTQ